MSTESEIIYKGLTFRISKELNYLEVLIDEVNFNNQEKYISSVSSMLEYALFLHPNYIILNRECFGFIIPDRLFPFTSKNIIEPLKSDGVLRIICTGKEEEYYSRYKEIEILEPFIKWVKSKKEAEEWIEQQS